MTAIPAELRQIYEKVLAKERLSFDDGFLLLHSPHIPSVLFLANEDRRLRVGDTVYYTATLHVYPTNLCELSCPMCAFYAKPGDKKGWLYTTDTIVESIEKVLPTISEVHIVGGLWPACNLPYYQELFSKIKSLSPTLHIKALTAVEIAYLARLHGITIESVLHQLIASGLSALPGGGAEILVDSVRKKIAPEKLSSQEFLNIHKTAHALGLRSNVTMLYGHIEQPEHLIEHLCLVRKTQDETGGFHGFVPLRFQQQNNALGIRTEHITLTNDHLVYAVSRLMLDNIAHIKVLWNYVGIKTAQEILLCGANDMGSITIGEKVATMAGGTTNIMTKECMENTILQLNRRPQNAHLPLYWRTPS